MRPIHLRTRDDNGKPMRHTIVHCEVFEESMPGMAPMGGPPAVNESILTTYALTDAVPFTSTAQIAGRASTTISSPRSESVLFKKMQVRKFTSNNGIDATDTQRFPLDTLFTSPTLNTYAPTLFCTAVLENPTGNIGNFTVNVRVIFYVVIHSQTISDVEHMMGVQAWRSNIDFDWLSLNSMLLTSSTTAQSVYASYRRGGHRPERMTDPATNYQALFNQLGDDPERLDTYANLLLRGGQAGTMQSPDEAFGFDTGGIPDHVQLTQAHLDARTRTNFPPIRYDTTSNVKVML